MAAAVEPVEPQSLKKLSFKSLKRSLDFFSPIHGHPAPPDHESKRIRTNYKDPQVVTGSHDTTIKFWDLAAGKTMTTLTHHKKLVCALALHPTEQAFASASVDNVKKFNLPRGDFLHNMLSQQKTVINSMAVNEDGFLATAASSPPPPIASLPRPLPTIASASASDQVISSLFQSLIGATCNHFRRCLRL